MQSFSYSRVLGLVLAFALLFAGGCKKKKPAVPPPQAQAPTVTQQPEQKPEQTQPTQPTTQPQQPQEQPQTPEKPSPSKPKRSARRHPATSNSTAKKNPPSSTAQPPTPAAPATSTASAKPPDADVGQISPDMSRTAASQRQQSTTQLLDSTEQNLRALTRTLSNDEQNTVSQIRSYIVQSRSALKDSDLDRAYNLALKAHQLSDVLLRQQ